MATLLFGGDVEITVEDAASLWDRYDYSNAVWYFYAQSRPDTEGRVVQVKHGATKQFMDTVVRSRVGPHLSWMLGKMLDRALDEAEARRAYDLACDVR